MPSKSLLASLISTLSLALLGLACDMDDDPPASSLSADAGTQEPLTMPTDLRVMTDDGPAPADLACLGSRDQPSGGARGSFTLPAISFGQVDSEGQRVAIAGLEIQFFADNRIPASTACEDGCTLATDEGDGRYTFEGLRDGWLAYRVLERPASGEAARVMSSIQVNVIAGSDESLHTVLAPVMDGVHMALGIPRDPERAVVAGRLLDCNGDLVEGATIALRDTDGKAIATDERTRVLYLDDKGPNPTLRRTPFSGQWSVVNVPAASRQVVVEARAKNGALIACELTAVAPDTLSVLRIHPLRADAPAACAE